MKTSDTIICKNEKKNLQQRTDPFRLVTDKEFRANLDVIIAFYQMAQTKKKHIPNVLLSSVIKKSNTEYLDHIIEHNLLPLHVSKRW